MDVAVGSKAMDGLQILRQNKLPVVSQGVFQQKSPDESGLSVNQQQLLK